MKAGSFESWFSVVVLSTWALAGCVGDAPVTSAGTLASDPNSSERGDAKVNSNQTPSAATDGGAGASDESSGGEQTDKAAACARSFGDALKVEYGRLDGIVSAVVKPSDTTCTQPLADHVVVEVKMQGHVYRILVETKHTSAPMNVDARVRYHAFDAAFMPHGNWAEGWHPGVVLDYPATLGIRAGMFTPVESADLIARVSHEIVVGDKISIYADATSGSSATNVHRQNGSDGAILLHPDTGTPRVLAFHFDGQMF